MYCCTPKALYNHVEGGGGGSLLNHHQCAAYTWLPQDNGASALTTHQQQVERRESHRANQVDGDYWEAMIDKGQWWEFGQDTGVTPLLFTRSAIGFLMTTESQDLGLMSHPFTRPESIHFILFTPSDIVHSIAMLYIGLVNEWTISDTDCESDNTKFSKLAPHSHLRHCNTN